MVLALVGPRSKNILNGLDSVFVAAAKQKIMKKDTFTITLMDDMDKEERKGRCVHVHTQVRWITGAANDGLFALQVAQQ